MAKAIGRRLFAKATMGVPTVLAAGGGGSLMQAEAAMGAGIGGVPIPFDGPQTAADVAKHKIWNAIWKGQRERQIEVSKREVRRAMMGGFDPDLAVLNSMSVARRVQIQIDRNVAHVEGQRSWQRTLVRMMGGKPEDFE